MGDGSGLARWVNAITRGDAFASSPRKGAGLPGAEIFYYCGPYMLLAYRQDKKHFHVAAQTLGKCFQSDEDEALCDGAQLAGEIADGLRDSAWPSIFMHVSSGNDAAADPDARGGQRITDLRNRVGYYEARMSSDASTAKFISRLLPRAMLHKSAMPCLAAIFEGTSSSPDIQAGLTDLGLALHMGDSLRIDDRGIRELDRFLSPIKRIILGDAFTSLQPHERLLAVVEKVDSVKLTAKPSSSAAASASEPGGDKSSASGKLLVSQLTKPDAIEQLARLATYRISDDYDPISYLEMAHSGRWPPELRQAKLAAANALVDVAAKRDALALINADDAKAPIPALMQLAWGHVCVLCEAPPFINHNLTSSRAWCEGGLLSVHKVCGASGCNFGRLRARF